MKATELIKGLQNLVELEGADVEVEVTQSGYYAEGDLANIYLPEKYTFYYDEDGKSKKDFVWSIGHSHQSY